MLNEPERRAHPAGRARRRDRIARNTIAGALLFVAATLAVVSTLHLAGAVRGGSKPYDPLDAGIAEAIIGFVLAAGAAALLLDASDRGRRLALAATGFAILGFVVGLTFTIRGGTAFDVIYHATMLPVLIVTAIRLAPCSSATRSSEES